MYVLHVIESLFAKVWYQNCNGVGQDNWVTRSTFQLIINVSF